MDLTQFVPKLKANGVEYPSWCVFRGVRNTITCGERSSAGRASVCGTEGRGFKSHRSPQSFQLVSSASLPLRLHGSCTVIPAVSLLGACFLARP
jgi:hypothetical protein